MKKKYYIYKINTILLNILSIVILIFLFALTGLIYKEKVFILFDDTITLTFALMVPYLILHEILHSISYVLHGAHFKNVTYGVHIEKGILCCLCKENITKKNVLCSLLTPFIFIGVLTYCLGIYLNNGNLILLSIINMAGSAADLFMFFDFLKIKDFEYSEFDDPMAFGLYSEQDLSKLNLLGLKFQKVQEELERKDLKKLKVSKTSIWILVFFFLFLLFNLFMNEYKPQLLEETYPQEEVIYRSDSCKEEIQTRIQEDHLKELYVIDSQRKIYSTFREIKYLNELGKEKDLVKELRKQKITIEDFLGRLTYFNAANDGGSVFLESNAEISKQTFYVASCNSLPGNGGIKDIFIVEDKEQVYKYCTC